MDLKSNRSDLWRHMLKLVVGWEDYAANIQRMSCDMIKLQLGQHFCSTTKIFCPRATWISCCVGEKLSWLLYIQKLQHMHVQFDYFCSVATYDIIFWCRPVYHKTLILYNNLIYTILKALKWRHNPSQSSQRILTCGTYSPYKIWLGLWRHFYGHKIV